MSIMLGIRYLMERTPEEAVREFKKSLRHDRKSAQARYFLGIAYAHMGRLTRAERMFRRASDLDPSYVQAEAGRIVALIARGRHDEALEHFRDDLGGQEVHWTEEQGEALCQKVAEELEKTLQKGPNPPLYNSLGILHALMGQKNRAQTLWKQSLKLDPNQPVLHTLIIHQPVNH